MLIQLEPELFYCSFWFFALQVSIIYGLNIYDCVNTKDKKEENHALIFKCTSACEA